MRLLIVEDEAAVRDALVRALETEGYELVLAEDGAQALAAHGAHPADAIVLDVMLPGIDGLEVARRLRADIPRADPDADRPRRGRRPRGRPRRRRRRLPREAVRARGAAGAGARAAPPRDGGVDRQLSSPT